MRCPGSMKGSDLRCNVVATGRHVAEAKARHGHQLGRIERKILRPFIGKGQIIQPDLDYVARPGEPIREHTNEGEATETRRAGHVIERRVQSVVATLWHRRLL